MGRNRAISAINPHQSFLPLSFFFFIYSCIHHGDVLRARGLAPSVGPLFPPTSPHPTRRAGLLKLPTGWILSPAIIKVSRPQWRLYVPLDTPGGSSGERGEGGVLPFLCAGGVCVLPLPIPVSRETDTRLGEGILSSKKHLKKFQSGTFVVFRVRESCKCTR